jgi:hypothetical protein
MTRHLRWLWIAAPVICLIVGYRVATDHRRFQVDNWKAAANAPWLETTRLDMVDDLIASEVLLGKQRGQVETLLGSANEDPWLAHEKPQYKDCLIYRLGPEPFPGVDSMWLAIRWNESGVVDAASVVSD